LNIFISGSTGFVGTNLIQYLKESFNPTIFPITRDMFLKNAYPKLDGTIIHLAGKAHDLKNSTNNDEYQFVNVDLTKKIFNAFLDSEADVFIFISSVKAAADKVVADKAAEELKAKQEADAKVTIDAANEVKAAEDAATSAALAAAEAADTANSVAQNASDAVAALAESVNLLITEIQGQIKSLAAIVARLGKK
jgi:NAD dependent epimerase/dehydratase family enzyme